MPKHIEIRYHLSYVKDKSVIERLKERFTHSESLRFTHSESFSDECDDYGQKITFSLKYDDRKTAIDLATEIISIAGIPYGRFLYFPPIFSIEGDIETIEEILDRVNAPEEYKEHIIRGNKKLNPQKP